MQVKRKELNAQEMEAALLLFKGAKSEEAARQVGMNARVLRRRMYEQHFMAYREELQAQEDRRIKLLNEPPPGTQTAPLSFTRDDAAKKFLAIADNPMAQDTDRIRATREAALLFRLYEQPITTPNGPTEAAPDKPSFFRAVDYMQ